MSADTLLETYRLAAQNDAMYRAAQAQARASGTAIDQAEAGFRPTIKLEVDRLSTRQKIISSNNPVFATGSTTFPTFSETLSLTQPIYRKDAIERMTQARAVVRQSELTLLAAEQDLMMRTTAAYLSVLAASDSLALAVAERESVGKSLDLERERLRMGLGTITNQYDAEARFAITQAREIEAQNKLRDARQAVREITARPPGKFQTLREDFALASPAPLDPERWVEQALEQNLGLRARREAVVVARQEVRRQESGHYPSVNLLLSHNRRDAGSTLFGGGSNVATTELTLRLTVPIYEGGMTTAMTREAAFRLEKAQEEFDLEQRAVERETRAAYDGTLSGIRLVRALGQSVLSQQSALEGRQIGMRAGRFTLQAVLDAQRDLYLAKRDHAQARYDYLINQLKLRQAAGTLSETDLVNIHAALR